MADSDALRERLKLHLAQVSMERAVGVGGLALFSAASALALAHPAGTDFVPILTAWLGSLGLNVLASVVVDGYKGQLSQPTRDETERLVQLARAIEPAIKRDAKLRVEIGTFLDSTHTFEIAHEIVSGNPATHSWLLFKIYQDLIEYKSDFDQIHQALARILREVEKLQAEHVLLRPFTLPPLPTIFLGRAQALVDLKQRLGITASGFDPVLTQRQTIVRGWPGVGKTTLITVLAYDPDLKSVFPDGILWTSLGPTPDILSKLAAWGRALGTEELLKSRTIEEAQAQLAALLENKRMLLLVDDLFQAADAIPFQKGGLGCATLITTRFPDVAELLDPTLRETYLLRELDDDNGVALLKEISPTVVQEYPQESHELVHDLEGLPLALHVAGRLLNVERKLRFDIRALIEALRKGAEILRAKAPKDRTEIETQTLPSVAALLQKSTDLLPDDMRDYYAFLGVFAPKPATFDIAALKDMWLVDDPKPMVRILVDRGLLEPVPLAERFQMHALLVMHAKSLLTVD